LQEGRRFVSAFIHHFANTLFLNLLGGFRFFPDRTWEKDS
jgi:hypothetical protein